MNTYYQVTVLCKCKNKIVLNKILKTLSQYGDAWRPSLFYEVTISSKYKIGEIAFLLNMNSHLIHTFVLALELVRANLQSSTPNCVLNLYEVGNLGE